MANKILIQVYNKEAVEDLVDPILVCPLVDNITIVGKSSFSSLGKMIPTVASIRDKVASVGAIAGAKFSTSTISLSNKLDVPIWQNTDPIQLSCKLSFYTKTDPFKDVFMPCKVLQAQTILSTDKNGKVILPGVNINMYKHLATTGTPNTQGALAEGKLIGFEIPGVIYIPTAFIESATPTFSKEVTKSGAPLWATVDLQIKSTEPASTDFYDNVYSKGATTITQNIKTKEIPKV